MKYTLIGSNISRASRKHTAGNVLDVSYHDTYMYLLTGGDTHTLTIGIERPAIWGGSGESHCQSQVLEYGDLEQDRVLTALDVAGGGVRVQRLVPATGGMITVEIGTVMR